MEEVLNKDVFIGVFILLLIIAILINLFLLLLLLLLQSYFSPRDVIPPLSKLMTSCQARHFETVGWGQSPKRWLVAVCCLCHLCTACLHHALVVHLYKSRDGYLPPPANCSILVLTEVSAFLFPTLSRLLVCVLVVTEVLHMTSVRYVRGVTCLLMTLAGVYVSAVLLPVFFFLYLESASEPCYAGRSILRYTSSGARGRVLPVVSYVLPVVFIILAVVVMIATYNFRENHSANNNNNRSKSFGGSGNFSSLGNGAGHLKNNNVGSSPQRYSGDGQSSVRALNSDLQLKKNTKSDLNQSGCDYDQTDGVSFPWDTLVVCVLVVMLEFVFCVRQFAYWAQVDERIMSTSQWIQLWAADRTLSLLSLILVPCCWLFDSYIRRMFHCRSKDQGSKQSDDLWGKEHTGSGSVYASRHPETCTLRVDQNTLNSYESKTIEKGTLSFDGTQSGSYRKALTAESDIPGHSSSEESSNEFGEDPLYEHRRTSHNSMVDRGMNQEVTGNFQQVLNQQHHNAYSEQWNNDDVDTIMMWRGHRKQNRPAVEEVTVNTSTSPKRTQAQGTNGHSDFPKSQVNSSGDYPSVLISSDESNQTFMFKTPPALHPIDPEEPENTSWGEKYHKQSSSYGKGKTEGTPSLPRNGVSTPNVLSGNTAHHADVLKRNRSYPNMANDKFINHAVNNDDVYESEDRDIRNTSSQNSRAEWTNGAKRMPHRQEAQMLTNNNKLRTDDAMLRRGDKKTWHNGQDRREDYRMQQQHKDNLFLDDRRENRTLDYLNRQRSNINERRNADDKSPQPHNLSTYDPTMSRPRQQITYNTNYKPTDETLHNPHYQRHQPYEDRDSSRNTVRTMHVHPGQNIKRQVPPLHEQSSFTQNNFRKFDSGKLGKQEMESDLAKAYDLQREGVLQRNERQELTRSVPNSLELLQGQRMRNSRGMTEEGKLPYRQEAMQRQGHTDVAEVAEDDRLRKTGYKMERQDNRNRLDITGATNSQYTSTAHRRLPRQTAFIQGQGDSPSNNGDPDQRQDGIPFHRRDTGERDGRLGYNTFVNDLNPQPSRNKFSSAGHHSQGHSGYRDVDEYPVHRNQQYTFQEQGQGHVQHRGQGQEEGFQATQAGERNGRLTFYSHEPRRDRNPYDPESLC